MIINETMVNQILEALPTHEHGITAEQWAIRAGVPPRMIQQYLRSHGDFYLVWQVGHEPSRYGRLERRNA